MLENYSFGGRIILCSLTSVVPIPNWKDHFPYFPGHVHEQPDALILWLIGSCARNMLFEQTTPWKFRENLSLSHTNGRHRLVVSDITDLDQDKIILHNPIPCYREDGGCWMFRPKVLNRTLLHNSTAPGQTQHVQLQLSQERKERGRAIHLPFCSKPYIIPCNLHKMLFCLYGAWLTTEHIGQPPWVPSRRCSRIYR